MQKLTKSLPIIKERNCTASFVLDTRTHRRNVTEYPLAIRFTVDRKFFYHQVGGTYTEKRFSDICNATRSGSENYKEQKMWRDTYVEKYHHLIVDLNKGGTLTYEMVRQAVITGNSAITPEGETISFISVWKDYIHNLMTNDNGARYSTGESHECALKSWCKIMGEDCVKGFKISTAEVQKWKDGMHDGVPGKQDKDGRPLGKISDTTAGIYLRNFRTIWNVCLSKGYLKDTPYPFGKGQVTIPKGATRKQSYLRVDQMTELYNLFISKAYPVSWSSEYTKRAHYSLGLFLVQYLCNGFNLTDAARLTYDDYYYQNSGKAFLFNRKKTKDRSGNAGEVSIPIIKPLQTILDQIAAPAVRGGFVFPDIFHGEINEEARRKLCLQENSNLRDRMERICHEALGWDISIKPTSTWARHSFATNMRNAGVEIEYISESMGHSAGTHAITQIYIDNYPLEKQFEYNNKLLNLPKPKTERENLLDKLSTLSEEEIKKLLASIA